MTKIALYAVLLLLIACNNPDAGKGGDNTGGGGADEPTALSYSIVETFPHDTSSYTQGLIVYKGEMYEGTGNYYKSHLIKVNIKTGAAEKKLPLPDSTFGEGITILHDTLYQLTWKEHVVFAYKIPEMKLVKTFRIETEGWGLTTDGTNIIASDGGSNLYYYDPATFALLRTQSVMEAGSLAYNLNELEFMNGYIYANQYEQPYIFKIDPASGIVVAKVDLSRMWGRVKNIDPVADVPNGIAYDSVAKKIYVTGKLWPELYQVEFSK